MRTKITTVATVVAALAMAHCGGNTPADGGTDVPNASTDGNGAADVRNDTPSSGPSRAGAACSEDSMCGTLMCDTSVSGGFCTGPCTEGSAQTETAACGGSGSTCLSIGDEPMRTSICTKSCRAGMNTGCRAGHTCTGFWYTHAQDQRETVPGCAPRCATNMHCNAGEMCNVRTGGCGMTGSDPTKLADGQPCTPPAMGQPSPCRGICFVVSSTDRTHGVCGSFIDIALTQECPDEPMVVQPRAPMGDNLAICIFRDCSATQCCPRGMTCEGSMPGATMGACFPIDDPMSPNVACTGGGSDGGTDGGSPDAGNDSGAVGVDVPSDG